MSFIDIGQIEIKLKTLNLIIYGQKNLDFFLAFYSWTSNFDENLFRSFDDFLLENKELNRYSLTISNWDKLEEEDIYLVKIDDFYNQELLFWRLTEFYRFLELKKGFDFKDFFIISEIQFSMEISLFLTKNEIESQFSLCKNISDTVIVAQQDDDSTVLAIGTEFGYIIFRAINSCDINIEITYKNFDALNNLRDLIIEKKQENIKTELKSIIIKNLQQLQIPCFKLLENLELAFNRKTD